MTEDPSRLLSQESDAFAASLLRSARDGDRDTARSHKAAVLGAAGGAALGGAGIAAATRLSSRGIFSMLGGKWLVAAVVTLGGLGAGAALLWPRDAHQSPLTDVVSSPPADVAPSPSTDVASAPQVGSEPAQVPSPAVTDPAQADAPSAPLADSSTHAKTAPTSARDAKVAPSTVASAGTSSAPAAAPAKGAASGLAEEVAALRAAHDALGRGQSQRCLDAVNAYFAAFPNGHLSAEARYLRVEALFAGGQQAQAAALARGMLAANPRSPYAARLRTIAGEPAP